MVEVLLTLLPVATIFLCLTFWSKPAHISGVLGWLVTVAIAGTFFATPLEVLLKSSWAGILLSLPVTLVVATSIWQISLMESTGALKRVVVFIKTLATNNQAVQIMLINIGIGTALVSVGATPVSILPPIMLALGYSTYIAVALPALGYDALCTFSLLGAPLVIFSDLTKVPLTEAGMIFAKFLPVISTLLAFSMLWLVGRWPMVRKGFLPATISGVVIGITSVLMTKTSAVVLTGAVAGLATVVAMLIYLRLTGNQIIDKSKLTPEELAFEREYSLGRALSPWLILISTTLVVNFVPSIFQLLYSKWEFAVSVIPEQSIKLRPIWNAYFWIVVSTVLSIPVMKASKDQVLDSLQKWRRRAPKPVLAAAIFFAVAYVMNFSGFTVEQNQWVLQDPNNNMISVLANSSASLFASFYPLVASYLGLLGGFITGSESSAIAMFTKYNFNISKLLELDPAIITAGTAIGGGLASVISPAKLQNAAATIDAIGVENQVIKTALVLALILTSVAAVMTFILT